MQAQKMIVELVVLDDADVEAVMTAVERLELPVLAVANTALSAEDRRFLASEGYEVD